ncbi:MAG: AbrB family transcriptional regulator [Armatimonadota bacterium]
MPAIQQETAQRRLSLRAGAALAGLLAVAAGAGWGFDRLHVPVAWLLGPMAVGILWAALAGARPLPKLYAGVGQAVIGVGIGLTVTLATLKSAFPVALPLLLLVVLTGAMSLVNGRLLARWARVDAATGFFGSLPGAAGSLAAISDGLGLDGVLVAVLQYVRLLLVVSLAPVLVSLCVPGGAHHASLPSATPPATLSLLPAVIMLGCAVAGAPLGKALRFPAPFFLGPFLLAIAACWLLPLPLSMPAPAMSAALLLVGISIGVRFDTGQLRHYGKAVTIQVGLVLAQIALCLGLGLLFHYLTGVNLLTAMLGATPGGMEVMVLTAARQGGDPGLVLAMQMARWLMVILAGPWVAQRLSARMVQKGS